MTQINKKCAKGQPHTRVGHRCPCIHLTCLCKLYKYKGIQICTDTPAHTQAVTHTCAEKHCFDISDLKGSIITMWRLEIKSLMFRVCVFFRWPSSTRSSRGSLAFRGRRRCFLSSKVRQTGSREKIQNMMIIGIITQLYSLQYILVHWVHFR